ncbi:hypothetical protein [Nostoc sp.]|uniref:hypothetical protein n=1 Tax=Nostoc sp. TaxID=1180 RepID=UPI002FF73ECC
MARPSRSTPKPRFTLQVEPEDQEKLKAIALFLGYIIPSGKRAGEGSTSALMKAIAQIDPEKLKKILK